MDSLRFQCCGKLFSDGHKEHCRLDWFSQEAAKENIALFEPNPKSFKRGVGDQEIVLKDHDELSEALDAFEEAKRHQELSKVLDVPEAAVMPELKPFDF